MLEVLQILEAEVNLREETRVAEQAREAITSEEHGKQGHALSETQEQLRDRIAKVTQRIRELPDAEAEFAYEIGLLGQVEVVMRETVGILDRPETGRPAIAAETEVIELLLQSRRINPRAAVVAAPTPAAVAAARRRTRPWPCSGAASMRRKSARITASPRSRAIPASRCPRNSGPAWMNTSTGWRAGRVVESQPWRGPRAAPGSRLGGKCPRETSTGRADGTPRRERRGRVRGFVSEDAATGVRTMTKAVKSSAVVIAGLWVGVLFCLGFVVAPYLFVLASKKSPAVPNSGVAADLIGPLLYSSDVMGLIVGVGLLVALVFLRRRGEVALGGRLYLSEIGVMVAVGCAAVNYWVFTPRIKALQEDLVRRYGAFHLAEKTDPLLRRFSSLHETSTALFMIGFAAAFVGLVCMTQFQSRTAVASHGRA